jgi:hypothetical protein
MSGPARLSLRFLPDDGPWRRFELSSRGDRVVARLHVPDADGPHAVAVVLGPEAAGVEPLAGVATLTLDLPLLGERASPKWTERLSRCLRDGPSGAADRALVDDFASQVAHDVAAALDACAELPELSPRTGLLAVGPGVAAAARLAAGEPRLCAFALAPAGLARALEPGGGLAAGDRPVVRVGGAAEGAARLCEALAAS